MAKPTKTLIEQRDEIMISPSGSDPFLRTAHFLKPTSSKIPKLPSPILKPSTTTTQKPPLQVSFLAWRFPPRNWSQWVDRMASLHEPTWKNAGISEAIMSSRYRIIRNDDLVSGLVNLWCPETKSFVFSWGEATITLEDVFVLGGYSVLGDPVFPQLGKLDLEEIEIEEKLNQARLEIVRTQSKKASLGLWMKKFMDSGSELEHEAFLAFWLSRFVLNPTRDSVSKHVLSIAVLLARGTRIALGPAVLASIYRDLSLWKQKIVALNELEIVEDGVFEITLWSPLQLLQVWVFERFLDFSPNPNPIQCGEPRMARWDDMRSPEVDDVMLALDSARQRFLWRPYGRNVENLRLPMFYGEEDVWVCGDGDLDVEFESFGRFLRVGEIVGIDCVEQYLPHRVAMQFGIDQDLPGLVARSDESETPELAWKGYCEKINNLKFLIASRHFEADVSSRYLKWWKQSVSRWPQRNGSVMRCQSKTANRKKEDEVTLAAWLSRDNKSGNREKRCADEDDLPIAVLSSCNNKSGGRGKRCVDEDDLPIAALLSRDKKGGDRAKRCIDEADLPVAELLSHNSKTDGRRASCIDEGNLPIAALLRSRKKLKKRPVVELLRQSDESEHSSRNSWTQFPSTLCDAKVGGSQRATVDSSVAAMMKTEGNGNGDGGEGCVSAEAELIALGLEARVTRLEKLMEKLKDAKKIGDKLKKEAAVIWLD